MNVDHYPPAQITSALLWLLCRSIANPACPCAHSAILQHFNMLANHPDVEPQLRETCMQLRVQLFERQRDQQAAAGAKGTAAPIPATRH
ncbi:MAG: hypothetical protein AB7S51_02855 [Porticoccaceae bacterium]